MQFAYMVRGNGQPGGNESFNGLSAKFGKMLNCRAAVQTLSQPSAFALICRGTNRRFTDKRSQDNKGEKQQERKKNKQTRESKHETNKRTEKQKSKVKKNNKQKK